MTSLISKVFDRVKADGQMAFMPFVTAGDPDMAGTLELIRELARQEVDLVEVGFPYSDPIADGPVIQASYTRALQKKLHVDEIFSGIATLKGDEADMPALVAMVSFSIIFRMGPAEFARKAAEAGFAGMIVPDLPGDEAEELAETARQHGLDLVQLISPTTPTERVEKILKSASGFVYCISVAGTTGERASLPPELSQQLKALREMTDLPLAVGFGISRPEHVDSLRGLADGVIIGSAIVRQIGEIGENGADQKTVIAQVGRFANEMVTATHQS